MSSETRRKHFPFAEFEPKWQEHWAEHNTFRTAGPGDEGFDASKPKFYALDMFPYPSGAGLHVGHPEGYTATDIISRYKRMNGFNVLHPMGWDAFGLPAEQHAMKTGEHPRINTQQNVDNFRRQLQSLGFSYDWEREVNTTDPGYVRWTQWIFTQLYNSYFDEEAGKAMPVSDLEAKGWDRAQIDAVRLAYVAEVPVNWSPSLGTVLANEEVEEWKEKGETVERRPLKQWMLRITAYAERLIDELEGLDWPDGIKLHQRNWIGRSEGAEVDFMIGGEKVTVFTTRPDTLFGATYMVLAPEHPLVDEITTEGQRDAVEDYRKDIAGKSDLDRTELNKDKSGVFTGATATNPVNGEEVPVWIADYVLLSYGTGAIMAVPAHDERDFEFATKFELPIVRVVEDQDRSIGFQPMSDQEPIDRRTGTNLPHWRQDGATYAAAFRLGDSIPADVYQGWCHEKDSLLAGGADAEAVEQEFGEKIDAYLDEGRGECHLRNPKIADIVEGALKHFDRDRYSLIAWAVMPNHVHVIVRPQGDHELSDILHSWKSYTSSQANKVLGREGEFWQTDTYNRIIRDSAELRKQIGYVEANPAKANLQEWKWVSQFGDHRQDANATPPSPSEAFTGHGTAINSDFLDGLPTAEAKAKISGWLEEKGLGKKTVNYKLRDWLFSRQRYWGEPFPIEWDAGGKHRALPDSELPLLAPELEDYKPTGSPEPLLSKATDWVERGDGVKRETNTMPQWAGSCWYYLRYADAQNPDAFIGKDAEEYWMGAGSGKPGGIDLYIGGTEHAVLHLLYARFWHKVLYDLGHVSTPEPFQKLVNQGLIMGEMEFVTFKDAEGKRYSFQEVTEEDGAFTHKETGAELHRIAVDPQEVEKKKDHFVLTAAPEIRVRAKAEKMSKSRGNVVNPDDVVALYGADSLRLYEMFMGPLEQVKPWSMSGVEGVYRFLARVWRMVMEEDQAGEWTICSKVQDAPADKATLKVLHETIGKVGDDIEKLAFNTAISQMMVCTNQFTGLEVRPAKEIVTFLSLLSPFAPHIAEELYQKIRVEIPAADLATPDGLISSAPWPEFDESLTVESEIEMVVQVNGKVRDKITVAKDAPKDEVEAIALKAEKVGPFLEGNTIRKVIVVPGRLVNVVAN